MIALLAILACAPLASGPALQPSWDVAEKDQVRLEVIEAYIETGAYERALGAVNAVRSDGLDGPELDNLQARGLIGIGLSNDAVALLEPVRNRDWERHKVLSLAYLELGQTDAALSACEKALKLFPRGGDSSVRADLENNLGFVLGVSGAHAEALEHYQAALKLNPTLDKARNNQAFSLAAMGRDKEALAAFVAALGSMYGEHPELREANAWFNLGLAQRGRGDDDSAEQSFQHALALVPDHPRAREALAAMNLNPEAN